MCQHYRSRDDTEAQRLDHLRSGRYTNDMPLSTLIENNNESMDVNFVGRNNFGNHAYRGNFNPRPYPSNS